MTTAAPWADDTAALLARGGVSHVSSVTVVTATDTVAMPVIDGTLTFDEGQAPRVDLSLTTHLVGDNALMARIDPRIGARVQLSVGYSRPDGWVDVHPIADLGLRSRVRNRPDDTLELVARSDEALIIDDAASVTLNVSTATTADAIAAIIRMILPSATVTTSVTSPGPAVSLSQPDGDKWQTLQDFADQIDGGTAVYDDGLRGWWIVTRPNVGAATPDLVLSDGPTGTLVSLTLSNDREAEWFNRVKMLYTWTDTGGVDHRVVAVADAPGPGAPVVGNVRTLEEQRSVPATTATATAAAKTLVKRTVTRGRSFEVQAPSCYWIRPGHTVQIVETGKDPENHLVAKIAFDLRSGLMTITTRQPETLAAWNSQPPTLVWDAVSNSMRWDDYGA